MKGTLNSEIQSYDIHANPKYQTVEYLLELMDEQFGMEMRLIQDLRSNINANLDDTEKSLIALTQKDTPYKNNKVQIF